MASTFQQEEALRSMRAEVSGLTSNIKRENLERWYCWTYQQGSKGDADIENSCVDTAREGQGGANGQSSMETDTLLYVK